jgi:nucleotide-binding universal stress UspA family protein
MFRSILVPTDFAAHSPRALAIAIDLARAAHGKVHLLHVIETIADSSYDEFEPFYDRLDQRAREELAQLAAAHSGSAVSVETRVVFGNRTREILRAAGELAVDLIVLASHRVDLNDPTTGWGTISYKVGVFSPCPVLLVK